MGVVEVVVDGGAVVVAWAGAVVDVGGVGVEGGRDVDPEEPLHAARKKGPLSPDRVGALIATPTPRLRPPPYAENPSPV